MLQSFDPTLVSLAIALIGAGAIAGLLAGVFGIGGGAVLVPVLYQFLGILQVDEAVRMHISIGTSLAVIVPTSLRSFVSHHKRGAVDDDLLRSYLIAVPAGVFLGALTAAFISANSLKAVFAVIALAVAFKMLFAKESWKLGKDLPSTKGRAIAGVVIGFFSSLMGIGGGVMNNSFMTLYNRPIHQAVATSSGLGVLISIPGTIGYVIAGWGKSGLPEFSVGFINLLAVILIIPVTIVFAPLGVKMAHALPKKTLSRAFGVFLIIVAIRFFLALNDS
ncbi:sulfite exporter TauE/SafE family protein [Cohaesibacter celericrescens]|uniref:sulfite exporter TauE/SafE family protein n=1 Tax=Cohaesibacter celericrescens TaxID=2067669 RepID=UPI003565D230